MNRSGISASIVAPVVHELTVLGYDKAARLFATTDTLVGAQAADAMFDEAATMLQDATLALTIAKRLPIGSLGELDYALCASDDLGTGLARVARFYRLATERVHLSLEREGNRAVLVFRAADDEKYSRHWREFAVAIIAQRIRQSVGANVRFEEVAFAHAAPKDARAHAAFFGVPVHFGVDSDRLVFDIRLLDHRLRTAVATLGDLLEAKMREMTPPDDHDAFVVRARRTIATLLDRRDVRLASVASKLGMSKRTLQRELERAKTSHKNLVDDVRKDRALRLLESGKIPIRTISEQLAFSEPRAFFRAFRRWTGTSPAALRKRMGTMTAAS